MLLLHLRCCLSRLRGHETNTPTSVRISLAVDSQTGPVGSRYGPGGSASPYTTDRGTSEHTGPLTIHANVRRRLQLRALLRVRPHTLASGLFALRGEEARVWARTVGRKRRFWKGDSRRCYSIGGISPTVGEGHIQCTSFKTATTPFWRHDPQGQRLCNTCGLFFVSAVLDVVVTGNDTDPGLFTSSGTPRRDGRDQKAQSQRQQHCISSKLSTDYHRYKRRPWCRHRNSMTNGADLSSPARRLAPSSALGTRSISQ